MDRISHFFRPEGKFTINAIQSLNDISHREGTLGTQYRRLRHWKKCWTILNMFVFVDSVVFILFSEFIMNHNVFRRRSRDISPIIRLFFPIIRQGVYVCGIYVFAEDRNILRSFLIGRLWLRTCMEPYLLADLCGLSLIRL